MAALHRSILVCGCGAVAVLIPNFVLAMGFMGSLTLPFLTFIFPALFFLKLHRSNCFTRLCCCVVIVVGVLGCVAGLASNIHLALQGSE